MSGTPTEAEIQTQWRNAVDVIETARLHIDGTMADGGGKFDVLLQSLEGEYTPSELANWVNAIRAGYSSIIDPATVLQFLQPIIFEYAAILSGDATNGYGSGYRDVTELFSALYEWFHDNSLDVQSRNISFDATATAGAANIGNGAMSRLTVDQNGYALEACHVERKMFRCRNDQNSGLEENAEAFEFVGSQSSYDAVLRASFGSGESGIFLTSSNAGSGSGGSLLANSSFSTFNASATNKFDGWVETTATGNIAQDTTNFYRTHPGSQTDASLQITGGSTVTMKQTLANMRVSKLDPNTPYFLRVMLNKTVGTAVGGSVTIRCGSQSATVTIAALAANWAELIIPLGTANWFANFNEDPFDIEIEWSSSTSGTLLVDDAIFVAFDLVDGTWWNLRGNAATHIPWLVDDVLSFTDTGGAPTTGKIQWWLFVSGLGYLPSTTGAPSFTDPA